MSGGENLGDNHVDVAEEANAPSPSPTDNAPSGASKGQSFEAIEAEGNEARWESARQTALAVFKAPALVTPRRMALLGEEGLAAFVDETRSIARTFILRERLRQPSMSRATTNGTKGPAARVSQHASKPRTYRRPAQFRVAEPRRRSIRERLVHRIGRHETLKGFVADVLFGSLSVTAAIAVGLLLHRFLLTLILGAA